MNKLIIDKQKVIELANNLNFVLEFDSSKLNNEPSFLRFRYKDAPIDFRFAIILDIVIVDTNYSIDNYYKIFVKYLIDYGKYMKEQEVKQILNIQSYG
jgi:hypothetical protein